MAQVSQSERRGRRPTPTGHCMVHDMAHDEVPFWKRAFDFTLEHPEMTEALVLVSSNLGNTPRAYTELFERTTEAGKKNGAAAAARVWGLDPYQGPVREGARVGVHKIL